MKEDLINKPLKMMIPLEFIKMDKNLLQNKTLYFDNITTGNFANRIHSHNFLKSVNDGQKKRNGNKVSLGNENLNVKKIKLAE